MRSSVQILVLFSLILFSSCLKEELPVAAHQEGDFSISQVAMGSDYSQQIYFNLNDNAVVNPDNPSPIMQIFCENIILFKILSII